MNNFNVRVCAVVVGLLLSGCGNPVLDRPPVPREKLREIETLHLEPAPAPELPNELAVPEAAREADEQLGLNIEEARAFALQNNLDLRVQLLTPPIAREGVSQAEARFESLFTARASYTDSTSPTATRLISSQLRGVSVAPGVEIPLRTGGTIRLETPLDRLQTDNEFALLNPAYSAGVQATLSHPILRGAGIYVNEHPIRVASYNYLQSEARTKLEVIRVLTTVDRVYWRLYAARRELEVRKQEYDLAVAQLERARRQVDAGVAAEVEVVRAESGVADKREAIIVAENLVRDRERDLKRIMNEPTLEMQTPTILVPTTAPRTLYLTVERDALIEQALDERMEMLDLELQILEETANVAVARNAMLPLVALEYSYGISGLGGSFNEAFTQVRRDTLDTHRVGVRLEVPIGNELARSALRQALLVRQQTLVTRDQRATQIRQEILAAVDQLETNWFRILAARKRVELAERVLELEIRQFNQGLRTSTDVIDAQTRLANAESAEVAAMVDYQISQVDIAFATGTVLGATRVQWEPPPRP